MFRRSGTGTGRVRGGLILQDTTGGRDGTQLLKPAQTLRLHASNRKE